jgi:hypothetical protein
MHFLTSLLKKQYFKFIIATLTIVCHWRRLNFFFFFFFFFFLKIYIYISNAKANGNLRRVKPRLTTSYPFIIINFTKKKKKNSCTTVMQVYRDVELVSLHVSIKVHNYYAPIRSSQKISTSKHFSLFLPYIYIYNAKANGDLRRVKAPFGNPPSLLLFLFF